MISMRFLLLFGFCLWPLPLPAYAKDFFLTIGGGYQPSGNQASLERNVLFFQRLLSQKQLDRFTNDVFFADGKDPEADLQVIDQTTIPKANQLMAEFFGESRDLGLSYRNHLVPNVRGATSPRNIKTWMDAIGANMSSGDRLVLYVTSHGSESVSRDEPYNTSISLWNNTKIDVRELVAMLDRLPAGVSVTTIMVQCHAGGFARFVYNEGKPEKGVSSQLRCGFFATVHDRSAAGCTPEIDEATYVEYSTYFWEAIAGRSRLGQVMELPDYNRDGHVSFDEAHAYTILSSDTIDLPIKTSDEFLGDQSLFRDTKHPDLLTRELPYEQVVKFAEPAERAVLDGLSLQLELGGSDRLEAAERMKAQSRSRGRGRFRGRPDDTVSQLRRKISADLLGKWPGLANLMNPIAIELVTTRSTDFIHAIEVHPDYSRYRGLVDNAPKVLNEQEKIVKYERFIRTVENVILRENLTRMNDSEVIAAYQGMVAGESASLDGADLR